MSKYDKEREKLGIQPIGSTSSVATKEKPSKYAAEREAMVNPSAKYGTNEQHAGSALARQSAEDNQRKLETQQGNKLVADAGFSYADNAKTFSAFDKGIQEKAKAQKAIEDAKPTYRERVNKRVEKFPKIIRPLVTPIAMIEETPFNRAVAQTTMPEKHADEPRVGGLAGLAASIAIPLTVPGAGLGGTQLYNSAGKILQRAAPRLENSLGGRIAGEAVKGVATGVPLSVGATLAVNPQASNKELGQSALYGAGGGLVLGGLSPLIGKAFTSFMGRGKSVAPEAEQAVRSAFEGTPPKVMGNLRNATQDQYVNRIMGQIKDDVNKRMTPPLENPNELAKWIQPHLGDVSLNEIRKLSYNDMTQLANEVKSNMKMYDVAGQVANERGFNLDEVFAGKLPSIKERVAQDASRRAYGVGEAPQVNITRPIRPEGPAVPREQVTRSPVASPQPVRATAEPQPIRTTSQQPESTQPSKYATERETVQQPSRYAQERDELGFAQTVRDSPNTAPELATAMNESPVVGARTTDVLNRQEASKLIEKHGQEGLYGKLMAKTKQFSASEQTAAQILAKHYSSLGGEENLSKAIDLVSKTAKGGREMGQAIQALSQWNKLDAEGALLLGERQLNQGVPTDEWKKLTVAQGAPITEAAQRIGSAQETRSLADEVLNIVTSKQAGEALTDVEKATIKQFQDQVKLINEKGKGILSKPKATKANETIREVSQIEPKARTRDQVVSFLDAKADKARARLAASRNKISSTPFDIYADYAIIGASKIAKGVVKLSDFTEQMIKDLGESIKPHINEVFTKATNIFRKENGLPTVEQLDRVVNNAVKNDRFTPEEAKQFKAWASEIGHMSDEFKIEATQDLQAAMKELGDTTLGRQLSTVQTGAMLLNNVTLERNVIGNVAQLVSEKVSKVSTVPIDWAMSKLTGERTIMLKPMNQEKFWKNFLIGTKSNWRGVSPNGMLDSYGIHPNVFGKKNPLKYVSKMLGASLGGFDHAFYSAAKGDVLATYAEQLGKAQGLTHAQIKAGMKDLIVQLDDRIHELADHAGRYATYQDDTLLSRGAEGLKKGLNEVSTGMISRKLVDMGLPKSLSMEGFGAGDILTKFAKTPANLVMRGLDYSPVGFIRSLMDLGYFIGKRERFNQHQAVRTLGRAITGTLGLTGMGYILADAGILTGSSSMDKDTRSIQEQSGQGAYKVNWSALSRFVTSGLDYDAAKYQESDRLMDWQWLQPAAISVAMGVNANKAVKAKKDGADITGWQVAQKSLLGGLQTVLENPMVQGISNVIDATNDLAKRGNATRFRNIGKGVPASFVPTLLNQWRASTDNKQRETFSANMLTEMGNLMKNKVPGLSKSLPVSYDSLGNARERIQGGKENTVGQYLTAFFSPARMTEYQVTPEAKLVLDLMNVSGDSSVLPRIGNKSFHIKQGKDIKDLKVSLTAKQFSQYQQTLGTMVKGKLSQQSKYLSNPSVSLEKKVKRVNDILTDMGKKARAEIGTEMGFKKKDIKS